MKRVRAIFVSDVHLGCRYANTNALLSFLYQHQPDYLYLVGDIIDGWRLKKSWYWNETYSYLIRRIHDLMRAGTQVCYAPGNHDEFLRDFLDNLTSLDGIQMADEFVHLTADGRRLLVIHGDQFDAVVRQARWLSMLGDMGYNALLRINQWFNLGLRLFGRRYWSLSKYIKHQVKLATCFIGQFEDVVTKHAAARDCAGVICGHIHTPLISHRNGIEYFNTGDWVESCTGLVEHLDGTFEIVHQPEHLGGAIAFEPNPPPTSARRPQVVPRPHMAFATLDWNEWEAWDE